MSAEVLVSRPELDCRSMIQKDDIPARCSDLTSSEHLQPASGLSTVGFRSAKYTEPEWDTNNFNTLKRANGDYSDAERILNESKALGKETEANTMRTQAMNTTLLGDRLQDIHLWKSELERAIKQLIEETDLLLAQKLRLQKALDATDIPYLIATDNLKNRDRRTGHELVRDVVEEELVKEVDLIRCVQDLLKRTLNQAICQIHANREAKKMLEMDWSDKSQAYKLDDECGHYTNSSTNTQLHPNSAFYQEHISNRESWLTFTQNNLAAAARELQASMELRLLIDRVLRETTEDLCAQCACVERAFTRRCEEVTEAKLQLEHQLRQTVDQIGAQERNIADLKQAIYDKEAPLRVAQSRLHQRAKRSNMELCRDDPQISLVKEVAEIERNIRALQLKLAEARHSLGQLEDTRMDLEKDISGKANSLMIDQDLCLQHRMLYPTALTLSGY